MTLNEGEDVPSVRAITRIDYDIEADTTERRVRAEAVDADVKDVDVLCGQNSCQLMQESWLVVEPRTEGEVPTR